MRLAIAQSAQARGISTPNPPVGAVLINDAGAVVGVGHTAAPGGPHAEIVALAEAGDRARGATVVVTLEPCNHTGRTGPCAQALIDAGVRAVSFAVRDPNLSAAGGADRLRAAGVTVQAGLLAADVERGPLREWLFRQRRGRAHVTAKFATTIDGRIAAADGTSQWITGPEARARVHEIRSGLDAIVVGTATVLSDNPTLTARRPDGSLYPHQPTRVVAGMREIPASARIYSDEAPTLVVREHDPAAILAAIGEVNAVQIEGGSQLLGAFFGAGLVDAAQVYLAPMILGSGANAVTELGVTTLTQAHRMHLDGVERLGSDLAITLTAMP